MKRIIEYKTETIMNLTKNEHNGLMKYWSENKKAKIPSDKIDSYIFKMQDNNFSNEYYDCIQVISRNPIILCGCTFYCINSAFRWFIGEYEDEDELIKEDENLYKKVKGE